MLTRPKDEAPSDDSAVVARRLSRRWTVLQVVAAALIALAGSSDRLHVSDPTVPAPLFFLTLGILVFIPGFVMQRRNSPGRTEK